LPKLIISRQEQVLQEVELRGTRMSLGRHPQNDIVIEHRAVSAKHALFTAEHNDVFIEDLNSTNGTFVNGQRISRRLLEDGDSIVVAKFQIDFVGGPSARPAGIPAPATIGIIEVKGGPNAGKSLRLDKPLSTLGRPGVQVVAITRQGDAYFINHVDGAEPPLLNGKPVAGGAQRLTDGDTLELAGTAMQFRLMPI